MVQGSGKQAPSRPQNRSQVPVQGHPAHTNMVALTFGPPVWEWRNNGAMQEAFKVVDSGFVLLLCVRAWIQRIHMCQRAGMRGDGRFEDLTGKGTRCLAGGGASL